jgi:predicted transcriptional regulator
MVKESCHPNAYVAGMRNVRRGLETRTKILNILERESGETRKLAEETGLSYSVTLYHLKLMERADVVMRKEGRPHVWVLTGFGQKRLS